MRPLTLTPRWAVHIAGARKSSERRSRGSSYRGPFGPHVGSVTEYLEDVLAPQEHCILTHGLMDADTTGLFAPGYGPGDRSPGRVRLTLAERPGAAGTHRHGGVIGVSGRHRRDIPVKMIDHVALDSVAPDAEAACRLQPLPLVRAHESPGARHQGAGQRPGCPAPDGSPLDRGAGAGSSP